jgi:uncharacterized protein YcfJ
MKSYIILAAVTASILSTGCATQQAQNIGAGAALGAVFGALTGNNHHSAEIGGVLGGIAGAFVPTQQQGGQQVVYNQPPQQGNCSSGYRQINGAWTCMGNANLTPQRVPNCIRNSDGVGFFASNEADCRRQTGQ